jgi:dTDP-glucose 4,6-dehydratase
MNLLVTGGAGFIGSEFVSQLVSNSAINITVLDALTYAGDLRNLESCKEFIDFVEIDIRSLTDLDSLFEKKQFTHVVHFAAESHVDNSISNPGIFAETNVLGTLNLLQISTKFSIERFLHVSTDEVYGSVKEGFSTETSPLNPSSPYSASKAAAEHFVFSYLHTFDLPVLMVRCSNNYGPRQFPEKLITHFISRLQQNESVPVYGDGKNVREWMHVSDCARGIALVLEKGKIGDIYNISSGIFRENLEVTRMLVNIMGKGPELISFVEDRKGHDFRYAIDSSKIRKELGWEPKVQLEEGLKETVRWFTENTERLG